MSEPKLKPCPFCGGEAKVGRIFGHETVFCTECDACILPSPYNSFANTDKELDESIKMWNERVVKHERRYTQAERKGTTAGVETIFEGAEQKEWTRQRES